MLVVKVINEQYLKKEYKKANYKATFINVTQNISPSLCGDKIYSIAAFLT